MAEALATGLFLAERLNRGAFNSGHVQLGRAPQQQGKPKKTSPQEDLAAGVAKLPPPKCPTIYAVVAGLGQVGNPYHEDGKQGVEVGTEQLHFPALVPLPIDAISLDVECHISTAFATVEGTWAVNCIRKGQRCDCLLALPMQYQGTVASVEVEMGANRVYTTVLVPKDEASSYGAKGSASAKVDDYETYNPELFRLTIPQVEGGAKLGLKITWFQAMVFDDGKYSVSVPFTFDDYASVYNKSVAGVTRITCTINTGTAQPVEVGEFNHPMKGTSTENGRASFSLIEETDDSPKWIGKDFVASYTVWAEGIFPNLIVQDPSSDKTDWDTRGTFCLSIAPPDPSRVQAFQRAVIFLLDRSGSMTGKPITDARQALLLGLTMLQSEDTFNIIAFDHEALFFSPTLVSAKDEAIGRAKEWVTSSCEARGGTDILTPLRQAMGLLQGIQGAVPYIFLITDGAVDNEPVICREVQAAIAQGGPATPRISTFGIGHYCNYYFLKMLALIGRGISDVAFSSEKIQDQMKRMLVAASTPLLTNISLAIADLPKGCEVYPFPIPDLFCGNPLVVSGRFHGKFPETIKIVGLLPGGIVWELSVPSRQAPHIPLSKVFARQHVDLLTAQAWLQKDKHLEHEAVNLSMATGIPCEYTRMVGFETTKDKYSALQRDKRKGKKLDIRKYTSSRVAAIVVVGGLAIGFGSIAATLSNLPIEDAAEALFDGATGLCGDCGLFELCCSPVEGLCEEVCGCLPSADDCVSCCFDTVVDICTDCG